MPQALFWTSVLSNRAEEMQQKNVFFFLPEEDVACQHNLVRLIIMCLTLLPVSRSVAHPPPLPSPQVAALVNSIKNSLKSNKLSLKLRLLKVSHPRRKTECDFFSQLCAHVFSIYYYLFV